MNKSIRLIQLCESTINNKGDEFEELKANSINEVLKIWSSGKNYK